MTDHLEWLANQARIARQRIEKQPEAMQRIYEADIRVAMSGRGDGAISLQSGDRTLTRS